MRLDLVATAGVHDSNLLLEKRDVDLAVVRLDDPLPTSAALVALLRTNVVIAVAPARFKLENLSDVRDKRVGLVSRSPLDEPSFVRVLDMFGIKPTDVKLTIIKPEEVAALTSSGQIDCVVVLGVPADPEVMAVVYAVDGKKKSPPTILDIELGESLKESALRRAPRRSQNTHFLAGSFPTMMSTPSASRPRSPPTGLPPAHCARGSITMRSWR